MRIRSLSLALGTAAVLAASALVTPAATAAELSISGDMCTIQFTTAENIAVFGQLGQFSEITLTELKKALPTVAGDIDAVVSNPSGASEELVRIEQAAIEAGFEEGEIFTLLSIAIAFKQYQDHGGDLFDGDWYPTEDSFTKAEAAQFIAGGSAIGIGESNFDSAAAKTIYEMAAAPLGALDSAVMSVYQACIDGEPGSYDLSFTGGGNGGGQAGGSTGSSGFSFGSS